MRKHRIAVLAATAALASALLTGCADQDPDGCQGQFIYFIDGRYHYGSPKGKLVPDHKLPKDARNVPGYRAPAPAKPKAPDAPKAPAKPAPAKPAQPRTKAV